MKTIFVSLLLLVLGSGLNAQNQTILDLSKPLPAQLDPMSYSNVREADVMWSKRIWRVIDLNEKINLPFKYPQSKTTYDRRSLIDVLMDAVEEGRLTAYSPYGVNGNNDDEFTLPMNESERKKIGGSHTETIQILSPYPPYDPIDTTIQIKFSRDNVMGYYVKEDWFFDKQRSVMEVRIIGIAPLVYAVDEKGNRREGNIKAPLFWIYYPDARKLLANAEAFNRGNNTWRPTFDDLFQKRMFNSYIAKESNVYDRKIEAYTTGLNALLESDRIKDDILSMEHDLWEY